VLEELGNFPKKMFTLKRAALNQNQETECTPQ